MSAPCERADAELVAGLRAGDQGCLAGIYDRYADRLYDFCAGMLRDRDAAADAVQDTFLLVSNRIGQLRDPERLRPWLYAIARSVALAQARARRRVRPTEVVIDAADPAAGPEQLAEQEALRRLVVDVSDGLSEADRAMLRLHLHGLEGAELAAALGVSASTAHVRLSRLRDQVERSLGALLVARLGRRDCDELAAVLGEWDGRFTPLLRKRVARHVDSCPRCGARRRVVASPWALLSGVVVLPAPAELRERVLGDPRLVAPGTPEPGSRDGGADPRAAAGPEAGLPATLAGFSRSVVVRGAAAAVLLAVLATGAAMLWVVRPVALPEVQAVPPAPVVISPPAPAAPSPLTAAPPDTADSDPTTPAEVPPPAGTPSIIDVPPMAGSGPPRDTTSVPRPDPKAPPGPIRVPHAPPPASDTVRPVSLLPRIVRHYASPGQLEVRGCPVEQAKVRVVLAAEAPATAVLLSWYGAGGVGSMPMQGSRSTWSGSLGPFPEPGQALWWVTASNGAGSTTSPAGTIVVASCRQPPEGSREAG